MVWLNWISPKAMNRRPDKSPDKVRLLDLQFIEGNEKRTQIKLDRFANDEKRRNLSLTVLLMIHWLNKTLFFSYLISLNG